MNSRTSESSAPVESTRDSVARNWSCPVRINAIVVDGARMLEVLLAPATSIWPLSFAAGQHDAYE